MLGLVRLRIVREAISKYSTLRLVSRSWLSAASLAIPTSAISLVSLFIRLIASCRNADVRSAFWIGRRGRPAGEVFDRVLGDRKSTRLNSSHLVISYAVFCLK